MSGGGGGVINRGGGLSGDTVRTEDPEEEPTLYL